ncbi:hypothetical protein MY4038_010130 [Beauveria bassiana]
MADHGRDPKPAYEPIHWWELLQGAPWRRRGPERRKGTEGKAIVAEHGRTTSTVTFYAFGMPVQSSACARRKKRAGAQFLGTHVEEAGTISVSPTLVQGGASSASLTGYRKEKKKNKNKNKNKKNKKKKKNKNKKKNKKKKKKKKELEPECAG